jgi:hypothetical protein
MTIAPTISRVPMGITVARIMIVEVGRPLLPPPLLLSLLPPLVVKWALATPMLAIVPPATTKLFSDCCEASAAGVLGALKEVILVTMVIEPEAMIGTTQFCTLIPAA